tara:strand:- start:2206 stop:3696 length:1491 start_codon:yes stop_codon:yes gene_type:complete
MTTKITEQNISNLANTGIDWQAVKTSDFTASAGKGYFVNTASGAVTVTLPSSPIIGDTLSIVDYGGTSATNNIIIAGNGSKILASSINKTIKTNEVGVVLVFTDSTKGWVINGAYVQTGLVGVPGAPTIGTAVLNGVNVNVPFTQPADNGDDTITSYTATANPGGVNATLTQAGSGTITVTGLAQNTAFTFTVVATNSIGVSAASAASNSVTTPNPEYVAATGGTVTTVSTNFKVHKFTGDSTFVVSNAGNAAGANQLDYLVVAGGGGGNDTGGGGGGGYRLSAGTSTGSYSVPSPHAACVASITAAQQTYPVTIGGGGGGTGANSVFSTITSAGGGAGSHGGNGGAGGSGGGAGYGGGTAGAGNTPPVSPSQGNNGGASPSSMTSPFRGAGGGGSNGAGSNQPGGNGGPAAANSITGSSVTYAGGGGGAGTAGSGGAGGSGGATPSGSHPAGDGVNGANGAANRGGGAGSASGLPSRGTGGTGGSGVVFIRYKFQ